MERGVGIIKEIDKLGRIVIPKELRERFFLSGNVEIIGPAKTIGAHKIKRLKNKGRNSLEFLPLFFPRIPQGIHLFVLCCYECCAIILQPLPL